VLGEDERERERERESLSKQLDRSYMGCIGLGPGFRPNNLLCYGLDNWASSCPNSTHVML